MRLASLTTAFTNYGKASIRGPGETNAELAAAIASARVALFNHVNSDVLLLGEGVETRSCKSTTDALPRVA